MDKQKPETKKAAAARERAEARQYLLSILKPGDTVYTILNHVSRSRMSRSITPLIMVDNEPRYLTYYVALLFGQSRDRDDGVTMSGCGKDMGFALVYSLSRYLFPEGFCPSPLAVAPADMEIAGKTRDLSCFRGRNAGPLTRAEVEKLYARGWRFLHGRNGNDTGWDNDGGYALRQRWL